MKKNLLTLSAASIAFLANTTLFAYPYSNQNTNPSYNNPSYNQTPSTYYDNLDNDQNQYYQNQGNSPYNRNSYNSSDSMQTPQNNSYYYNQNQEQNSPSYNRNPYIQTQQQNPSYYYNQSQQENPSSYYNQNQSGYQQNSTNNSRYNANPNSSSYMNKHYYHHQVGYAYDEASRKPSDDKYPQDSAASEADRQLNEKIRSKISGWFTDSYKNVSLRTANGIVNIGGTVKTNDDAKKLLDEISKIEGVRNVNAHISVEEDGYNKSSNNYNNSNNYNSNNSYNKYPQDRATSEGDRQLNAKIRDKISGWFTDSYKNVALSTSNGNVTISGLVKNNDDLTSLVQEIRKVEGVRNVGASNVQFTEEGDQRSNQNSKYPQDRASSEADRQLNEKIRDKISGWFTDSYKNVALSTSNGNVKISGLVKNNDDLTKLVEELRKIDGVRNVSANVQFTEESRESAANFDNDKQMQDNSKYAQENNSKYPQDRAGSEADRQLNEKIRSKISGWFVDNYKNIALNTSNGNVSITGFVNNNDDLTSLLNEIRKIDGVRNVNNNVQVKEVK